MKVWVIINCAGLEKWGGGPTWQEHHDGWGLLIKQRPTFVHRSRERAEKELCRLAATYGEGKFLLFESIALGEKIEMQITGVLHGQEEWAAKHGIGWKQPVGKVVLVPQEGGADV